MFNAQVSVELTDEHFKIKLKKMLEITNTDLNRALLLMKNVFKDYQKWRKRRNK